jgi:DNA-binding response OmpR family regulator
MTAQSHETAHYLDIGAIGVVIKPFDPMTLCDQITHIWAARRNRSQD